MSSCRPAVYLPFPRVAPRGYPAKRAAQKEKGYAIDVGPVLRQLLTRTDDFLGGPDHLTFCDKLVRGQVPEQVLWAALILVEPPRFDDGLRLGE